MILKWDTMIKRDVMMKMTGSKITTQLMITNERNARHDSPTLFPNSHLRDLLKPRIKNKMYVC